MLTLSLIDTEKLQMAQHNLIVGVSKIEEFLTGIAEALRDGSVTAQQAAGVLDEVAQYARATVKDMSA